MFYLFLYEASSSFCPISLFFTTNAIWTEQVEHLIGGGGNVKSPFQQNPNVFRNKIGEKITPSLVFCLVWKSVKKLVRKMNGLEFAMLLVPKGEKNRGSEKNRFNKVLSYICYSISLIFTSYNKLQFYNHCKEVIKSVSDLTVSWIGPQSSTFTC